MQKQSVKYLRFLRNYYGDIKLAKKLKITDRTLRNWANGKIYYHVEMLLARLYNEVKRS